MAVRGLRLYQRVKGKASWGVAQAASLCAQTSSLRYSKSEIALLSTEVKSSATSSLINHRSDL